MSPITYHGVTESKRLVTRPFIAQIVVSGHNYYLGGYSTANEAARIYDNAAYWFSLEGYKHRGLNFPAEYERDNTPQPTPETLKAQARHRQRVQNLRTTPPKGVVTVPDEIFFIDSTIKSLQSLREKLSEIVQENKADPFPSA